MVAEILYLLNPEEALLHRRYIEDHLYTAVGAEGTEITNVLDQMVADGRIVLTVLKNADGKPDHVYSRRPVDSARVGVVKHHIAKRNEALDPGVLGAAGEVYVRQLLVYSRQFKSIPQRRRLGNCRVGDAGEPADLVVRYKDASILALPIVIEVKNTHERFYPGSPVFGQLLKKAIDHGGVPVLCAAHLSIDGRLFCEDAGIGVLHMTRQIAPWSSKRKIDAVSDLIGAPPFEYISLAKPLHPPTHGKARDFFIVSDRNWLTGTATRWEQTKTVIGEYYDKLAKNGQWRVAQRMIRKRVSHLAVPIAQPNSEAPCAFFWRGNPVDDSICIRCRHSWDAHFGVVDSPHADGVDDHEAKDAEVSLWSDLDGW